MSCQIDKSLLRYAIYRVIHQALHFFSSIMLLFKIKISELLNKLKNHILLFLRFKLYPEEIKLLFFKLKFIFYRKELSI